ncbi:unnamed protein product [Knipowitschia caucasica]
MRSAAGKHLWLLLLVFPLTWAVFTKTEPHASEHNTVWSQAGTRHLFARRKLILQQESLVPRLHTALLTPPRRCSRLMENCSRTLCCDPCTSCRCRLFNTICHCRRTNPQCLKSRA